MRVRLGRAIQGVAVAVLLGATPAGAVFPGEDGKVVYVSGRGGPARDDSGADVYIQDVPGTEGTALDTRSGQHRHPAWSPDLTRVAHALWDGSNNEKIEPATRCHGASCPPGWAGERRERGGSRARGPRWTWSRSSGSSGSGPRASAS